MKRRKTITCAAAIGLLGIAMSVVASTNVDPVNKWSWGENVGFMNWADANGGVDGVEVLADHLLGFIWGENIGWINTGNGGGPYANIDNTNFGVNILGTGYCDGMAWGENIGWINTGNGGGPYANIDNTNFGVNILGTGYCDGMAWGENVGWINFGTQPTIGVDGARWDGVAGRFRGYAWGENIGWVNLDDGTHFVGATPLLLCCLGNADKVAPGSVTFADITSVLSNWLNVGPGTQPGDANCDGTVNFSDITTVLSNWLNACP